MVGKLLDRTNNIKGLLSGWGLSPKQCDICRTASALLYCRADAAFLCGTCDSKMHVATCHGTMAARHERVWMCDVCEQAPAAVTCKADAAVLCTTCDHDIHSANPLAHRHERVPVVPFLDSAIDAAVRSSTSATSSSFLIPDNPNTAPVPATILAPIKFNDDDDDYGDAEALLIPNPNSTFLYNDSYILDCVLGGQNLEKFSQKYNEQQSYETQSFAITDSVVPTKSEVNLSFSNTADHLFDTSFIDFSQPAKQHNNNNNIYNDDDNGQNQLLPSFNFSARNSVSFSSDIGVVPEGNMFCNSATSAATGVSCSTVASGTHATPGLDRVARVLRYREKRKNRKFEKTIRYASRKAYAETRPRIKGRFVKRAGNHETSDDIEQKFVSDIGSGYNFISDQEYGVVPTF